MLNKIEMIQYLRMSLMLKSPEVETDEAYKFTDDDLWSIVQLVAPNHNPEYTVDNFPENEKYFAVLLAKKEVYYRLAVASAPFYPLKAEGAELRKDVRFEHYMSLIRRLEVEYTQTFEQFTRNTVLSTEAGNVGNLTLRSKHLTLRNYELATNPSVELSVDNIYQTSVEISWTKFNIITGVFKGYQIFLSESPVYDEYDDSVSKGASKLALITDIHRTKFRVTNLTPSTNYYICVVSEDLNGLKGISEMTVTTLE